MFARQLILLLALILSSGAAHAALDAYQMKRLQDFKSRCDDDGAGRSCYDYAQALTTTPGAIDRATAHRYMMRACELKFAPACKRVRVSENHVVEHRKVLPPTSSERHGRCIVAEDSSTLALSPNIVNKTHVHGQRVLSLDAGSVWESVDLKVDDLLLRVNKTVVNSQADFMTALQAEKRVALELERGRETEVIWYDCNPPK